MKKKLTLLLTAAMLISTVTLTYQKSIYAKSIETSAYTAADHITLTWSGDETSTQTITWRTSSSVKTQIIQYIVSGKDNSFKKNITSKTITPEGLVTDLGNYNLFSINLTNLKPGTKYLYRIGDGTNWTKAYSFSTEAKKTDKFKFLIFGDSQSGNTKDPNYLPWKNTIQNAYKANTDAKFFINLGDLVESGQTYTHWNNWFDAAKGVIDSIPAMPVQGNHETYGNNSPKPVNYISQFKLPQNGPDNLKNQVYSYDYGNIHFAVLDSQEDEESPAFGDILESQKKWLDADLAKTKMQWKIVMFHKTPYYNKATRTNEAIKAAFTPIFDKYHVDVVLNGHDHGLSRTYPIKNDEFMSKPSEGTVYYVTGRSGNKSYPDLSKKVWDNYFYDPQDEPNYIVATVDGGKLTLKALKEDGTSIDTYTIDKAKDTDYPKTVVPSTSWTKYANPVTVVYGNELTTPLINHAPMQKSNHWYVDLNGFISYVGGSTLTNSDGNVAISFGGKQYTISKDNLLVDSNVTLINADALNQLGFTYKFHPATNMLMFAK